MANEIEIVPVLNGWKVRAGCQEVVFTSVDQLCGELRAFLNDPETTRKRYLKESVNARWTAAQQPTEERAFGARITPDGQCEQLQPTQERNPGLLRGNVAGKR